MSKKNGKGKRFSLEEQVNRVIVFLRTHERTYPIAVPLNLTGDLDVMVTRYIFNCYIHWRHANDNYLSGNVLQAKKDLMYSLGCRTEAYNSALCC